MKLKNAVLFDNNFIESLMYFTKLNLPMKVSFPLKKCLPIFEAEEKSVKSARDELVKKYGKMLFDDDGNTIGFDINKASRENQEKFVDELKDLFNLEFEIPLETKIKIELKDVENEKISVNFLLAIESLIDFI